MTTTPVRSLLAATAGLLAFALVLAWAPDPARAGGDWNDAGIAWRSYDDGIAAAKKEGKPVCLVFYTDWCPHCTNYSKVFHDAKVVERAKKFVMIRVKNDENRELSGKFNVDGQYIPRTFFLSADGKLDDSIHAPRDKYKYFYSESDPASVMAGMEAALKKHGS
jgi:protein-disulfide reductase (glutathione)